MRKDDLHLMRSKAVCALTPHPPHSKALWARRRLPCVDGLKARVLAQGILTRISRALKSLFHYRRGVFAKYQPAPRLGTRRIEDRLLLRLRLEVDKAAW